MYADLQTKYDVLGREVFLGVDEFVEQQIGIIDEEEGESEEQHQSEIDQMNPNDSSSSEHLNEFEYNDGLFGDISNEDVLDEFKLVLKEDEVKQNSDHNKVLVASKEDDSIPDWGECNNKEQILQDLEDIMLQIKSPNNCKSDTVKTDSRPKVVKKGSCSDVTQATCEVSRLLEVATITSTKCSPDSPKRTEGGHENSKKFAMKNVEVPEFSCKPFCQQDETVPVKVERQKSSTVRINHSQELAQSSLYSLPAKAIEASIKSRKAKQGESKFGVRRDVVHKAIFRAMRRHFFVQFETMHAPIQADKTNFKDLVEAFIQKTLLDYSGLEEISSPNSSMSKEGMLLVVMTIISQQLTKSWSYKMKNQTFTKTFNKVMTKYSHSQCLKLFENQNFKLVCKHFLQGEGFLEAMEGMTTFKDNMQAYEHEREEMLKMCD